MTDDIFERLMMLGLLIAWGRIWFCIGKIHENTRGKKTASEYFKEQE